VRSPSGGVIVVIPTYNEVETIEAVVSGVTSHGYRVLVVDDASPYGTGRLADDLSALHDLVSVLHRPAKVGLGQAYAAGFAVALEDSPAVVCGMDADLSHDPARLPALVAAIEAGADVVIGSRMVPGGAIVHWPAGRRALSRWGNRYARVMLGIPTRDLTSGFRAFRSSAIEVLDPASCLANGYGFQVEMAWRAHRAGLEVVEVPITFRDREAGESKLSGKIVVEAMWLVTRWGLGRLIPGKRRRTSTGSRHDGE
jgi:dolichol-phosphate mannosyltransferase